MKSGFFLIDKPVDLTSFDLIRKLRKITGIKKMGHSGTLDPFATGLMIIAVGNGTRLLTFLEKAVKTYQAVMCFGTQTDTGDLSGNVIAQDATIPDINTDLLLQKITDINSQIPSKFSAIKIDGKKAYELARKDVNFEMKRRDIHIYDFKISYYQYPELAYECTVSAGTYIRTLSEQIASLLNTVAVTQNLRRTAIEDLHIEQAVQLSELNDINWRDALLSYETMFPGYQRFSLSEPDERYYLNGVSLDLSRFSTLKTSDSVNKTFVFSEAGKCLGLSELINSQLKPLVIFNQNE